MTKILRCSCSHGFQDREHGPGNRVHNRLGKTEKGGSAEAAASRVQWRCTVCTKVRG